MSRRRAVYGEQEGVALPASPVLPPSYRVPAGHCPKCGVHVGRAVRGHAKTCQGDGNFVLGERSAETVVGERMIDRIDVMIGR